jgi:hypothetical protein
MSKPWLPAACKSKPNIVYFEMTECNHDRGTKKYVACSQHSEHPSRKEELLLGKPPRAGHVSGMKAPIPAPGSNITHESANSSKPLSLSELV